jgi:cell pole-organizing protein PopZ
MLKEWLDEHLPPIIERLVQKEIQKISRRAELN